jgi:LacI family transcriptional regulator
MSQNSSFRLKQIAESTGLSLSTISRVLNNKPGVSVHAYEKVMQASEELGLDFSNLKKKPISAHNTVVIMIPDGANPFFHLLLAGVEEVSKRHGLHLTYLNSSNDEYIERQNLQIIEENDFNGAILIPHTNERERYEALLETGTRFVFVDRTIDGLQTPSVTVNNKNGALQATRYLLNLGHSSLLYLGGNKQQSTERERLSGFREALKEAELKPEEQIITEESFNSEFAYEYVKELLQKEKDFTAIFCADDVIAFGAKTAVEDSGLQVPRDISIIGYDDIPFARYVELSTVKQPIIEMGRNAMHLLIDYMSNMIEDTKHITLEPSLVIRSTCGRPQ